jgi:hypothetical protein
MGGILSSKGDGAGSRRKMKQTAAYTVLKSASHHRTAQQICWSRYTISHPNGKFLILLK